MTIEEFLDENAYNLSAEEYNAALKDYQSMDTRSWVEKYSPLMQEKAAGWNEVDDVKKSKPLPTRISDAFAKDKFAPGKAYLEDVYAKDFADVPREQFDEALSKMRDYYNQFVDEQDKEAGRTRRQKEVQNWGLVKSALTSDYEKQRYIDDPQAALFGAEAPGIGDAPETRWGSAADLGLGVAGAAGDAVPGWGSMAGPAVRVVRDVGHKVTDSPYQKEWSDIGKDAIVDASLTASTAWLPNFRREKRLLEGALPEAMSQNMKLNRETENIFKGVSVLDKVVNSGTELEKKFGADKLNHYFRETVNDLPDSYLKRELEPLARDVNIDWAKAQAIVNNYKAYSVLGSLNTLNKGQATDLVQAIYDRGIALPKQTSNIDEATTFITLNDGRKVGLTQPKQFDQYLTDIYNAKPLTKTQQKLMKPATALNDILRGDVGGALIQESKTVTGARSPKQAKRVRTVEDQMAIERIKGAEARFWEAGFKPTKVEGDLLWEAYTEWKEENKKKDAIKQSLLRGK